MLRMGPVLCPPPLSRRGFREAAFKGPADLIFKACLQFNRSDSIYLDLVPFSSEVAGAGQGSCV